MASRQDESSQGADRKARLLSHINRDHSISLTRYLQHDAALMPFGARSPKALAIDNGSITVAAEGLLWCSKHTLRFEPPLKSLDEARQRLVDMDRQATAALGQSPDAVTRYIPPSTLLHWTILGAVVFGMFSFSRPENFEPDSWLTLTILRFTPAFAKFCHYYQPWGVALIVAIHAVEASIMASKKLVRHTVPVGSRLWLLWVSSAFVEGAGAFVRFDAEVRRLRAQTEAKQH